MSSSRRTYRSTLRADREEQPLGQPAVFQRAVAVVKQRQRLVTRDLRIVVVLDCSSVSLKPMVRLGQRADGDGASASNSSSPNALRAVRSGQTPTSPGHRTPARCGGLPSLGQTHCNDPRVGRFGLIRKRSVGGRRCRWRTPAANSSSTTRWPSPFRRSPRQARRRHRRCPAPRPGLHQLRVHPPQLSHRSA